jgi:Acyl-CoA synthetases (AMP-forming)/AMP-acid ligases II
MDKPALREITLGQMLDEAIMQHPDNEAVVYVDRNFRMTYREFGELVDNLAKGLMAMGVQKGEKVAIWATNVPYWVAFQFATAKIGAVLLTVNTFYKRAELEYLLKQSECENLLLIDSFRDTDYVQTVYDLVPELKTQERGYLRSEKFPDLKRVFFLGQEKHRGMYSMPELLSLSRVTSEEDYRARQASLDARRGQHAVHVRHHRIPQGRHADPYNIGNNGFWIGENQKFTHNDRVCLPVPLFHCFGCVLGVLAAISHAATLVILEGFNPLQVLAAVEEEKCTALYGVPTMFIAVMEHRSFPRYDLSSLRTGIMAGSPCPVRSWRRSWTSCS